MKIFIVAHKDYQFPVDVNFQPIFVGEQQKANVLTDNTEDNIAYLNAYFSELTALYWIWKNIDEDIIGMQHYRRYFVNQHGSIATSFDLKNALQDADIILPKPRNYFIFSVKKHYIKAHFKQDLAILEEEVLNRYPEYTKSFNSVMNGTKISLYNMFVCRKSILDSYASWLFPILFSLEKKISYKNYDDYQKRVFGFLGERLFNVWVSHNNLRIKYFKVKNIEGENLMFKALALIKRHLKND